MALVERLMHDDTETEDRWIHVHQFFAVMCELAGGALTVGQIKSFYAMTPADEADFDALIALSPQSIEGRMMHVNRVHGIFILAERRVPQYSTAAEVRSKVAAIVFPISVAKLVPIQVASLAWNNMPAALTEIYGNAFRRVQVDLTNADAIRIAGYISTAGAASAVIYAQYSTDFINWSTLTANQIALNPVGYKTTAWENVPAGARGDVYIRLVGVNGDGAADPVINSTSLQVR